MLGTNENPVPNLWQSPSAVTFGLDSFGEVGSAPNGAPLTHPATIRQIVDEGVLADQVGVDHFALGEHHIAAMPVSTPDVVLAAIAARTTRIRLGSGVTVLSSDDPVRVYQRYSTLDAVSGGRAELILGRGSSIESFPLFGFELADYEQLFNEKLELFDQLRDERGVTWSGSVRAPLTGQQIYPRTESGIPTWIGVGGSPESVLRAARHGMGLMLAIIGGRPSRFVPLTDLFRQTTTNQGKGRLPIGIHSPGHVADTDQQAAAEYWPHYRAFLPEARAARGIPVPTIDDFHREISEDGSLYVGSPETVAAKIAHTLTTLGARRFDLKYGIIGMGRDATLNSIQHFGNQVIPLVRALLDAAPDRPTAVDLAPAI